MSKTRVKLILWALLLVVAAAGSLLLLSSLGNLVAYFQQGADPASALNIVPNVPPDLSVALTWLPDAPLANQEGDVGREMEPLTRSQIESAYLRAWLQWNLSHIRGEPYGLKTYFVGPALEAVTEVVAQATVDNWVISQVDSSHRLQLHFYSADGSIVALSDRDAQVAHLVRDEAGALVLFDEARATYDVIMLLEDGNWRVRHLLRTDSQLLSQVAQPDHRALPGFVGREGTKLVLNGQVFPIAGVNYYPQSTPWQGFWSEYDPAVIEVDLAQVRALGLNTLRTFIPFAQFGGASLEPAMLDKLEDFLDRAEAYEIKVLVTLFDFRTDYDPLLWPQADRHLEGILARFAGHPAILAWDLKNEPDLDYPANGKALVDAWLVHMARLARQYDPNHLITVGWSSPEAATAQAALLDFVSFHYYRSTQDLPALLEKLRLARPDQPLVLSEFGLPTWNSFFFPNGHTEREQAWYYAEILSVLQAAGSAGYLAWTLYDYPNVPSQVAGLLPWRTGPEGRLGVIDESGRQKPAAALLAPGASLAIEQPPAWARFVKPFWLTVYATAALVGMLVWALWGRKE